MMSMFTTTYGESVTSMPYCVIGLPIGPIAKGMTYIVRPFMQPLYAFVIFFFISSGSIQWFVGPASISFFEQMKVRPSTRATSLSCERAR